MKHSPIHLCALSTAVFVLKLPSSVAATKTRPPFISKLFTISFFLLKPAIISVALEKLADPYFRPVSLTKVKGYYDWPNVGHMPSPPHRDMSAPSEAFGLTTEVEWISKEKLGNVESRQEMEPLQ